MAQTATTQERKATHRTTIDGRKTPKYSMQQASYPNPNVERTRARATAIGGQRVPGKQMQRLPRPPLTSAECPGEDQDQASACACTRYSPSSACVRLLRTAYRLALGVGSGRKAIRMEDRGSRPRRRLGRSCALTYLDEANEERSAACLLSHSFHGGRGHGQRASCVVPASQSPVSKQQTSQAPHRTFSPSHLLTFCSCLLNRLHIRLLS